MRSNSKKMKKHTSSRKRTPIRRTRKLTSRKRKVKSKKRTRTRTRTNKRKKTKKKKQVGGVGQVMLSLIIKNTYFSMKYFNQIGIFKKIDDEKFNYLSAGRSITFEEILRHESVKTLDKVSVNKILGPGESLTFRLKGVDAKKENSIIINTDGNVNILDSYIFNINKNPQEGQEANKMTKEKMTKEEIADLFKNIIKLTNENGKLKLEISSSQNIELKFASNITASRFLLDISNNDRKIEIIQ